MAKIKTLKELDETIYPVTKGEAVMLNNGDNIEQLWQHIEKRLLDKQYPIGSVYMSATLNTVEAVHNALGGTWEVWGSGKVPVGVNASETEFATVEKSGGSKTMTISSANLPTHTHTYNKSGSSTGQSNVNTSAATGNTGSHTLTVNEIPAHQHELLTCKGTVGANTANDKVASTVSDAVYNSNKHAELIVKATGGSGGHTHSLGSHTHTLNNHSHTISTTSTNSGDGGFSNTATNNLQPYITCYMYKRIA